jgi:hypothetical protein
LLLESSGLGFLPGIVALVGLLVVPDVEMGFPHSKPGREEMSGESLNDTEGRLPCIPLWMDPTLGRRLGLLERSFSFGSMISSKSAVVQLLVNISFGVGL